MGALWFEPRGWVYRYDAGNEQSTDVSIYLTTTLRYRRQGKRLVERDKIIPGVTNSVRIRRYTGQVGIRYSEEQY